MNDERRTPDPELTKNDIALVNELTEFDLQAIDELMLSKVSGRWQKSAKIIAQTMIELPNRTPGIPDIFYAQRLRKLVEEGQLDASGDVNSMRYYEVRQSSNAV